MSLVRACRRLTWPACAQIQLTAAGVQPFAGKDLLIPWHQMSPEQRELLLDLVRDTELWHMCARLSMCVPVPPAD